MGHQFGSAAKAAGRTYCLIFSAYGAGYGFYVAFLIIFLEKLGSKSGLAIAHGSLLILAISLLVEVILQPLSGILADFLGKRLAIALAFVCSALGNLMFASLVLFGPLNTFTYVLGAGGSDLLIVFGGLLLQCAASGWLAETVYDAEGVDISLPDAEKPPLTVFKANGRIGLSLAMAFAGSLAMLQRFPSTQGGALTWDAYLHWSWPWLSAVLASVIGALLVWHRLKPRFACVFSASGDDDRPPRRHLDDFSDIVKTPLLRHLIVVSSIIYALALVSLYNAQALLKTDDNTWLGKVVMLFPWVVLIPRLAGPLIVRKLGANWTAVPNPKDRLRILVTLTVAAAGCSILTGIVGFLYATDHSSSWVVCVLILSMCSGIAIIQAALPMADDFLQASVPPALHHKRAFVRSVSGPLGAALVSGICLILSLTFEPHHEDTAKLASTIFTLVGSAAFLVTMTSGLLEKRHNEPGVSL